MHALSLASVLVAIAYLLLGVRPTPAHRASPADAALAARAQAVAAPEEVV